MTYEEYIQRSAPLLDRYKNARRNHCNRTAEARLREMAKLYSEYRGITYDDAMVKLRLMLEKR